MSPKYCGDFSWLVAAPLQERQYISSSLRDVAHGATEPSDLRRLCHPRSVTRRRLLIESRNLMPGSSQRAHLHVDGVAESLRRSHYTPYAETIVVPYSVTPSVH